jgi:hypothetical protein
MLPLVTRKYLRLSMSASPAGNVEDLDVHPGRVLLQPAQARIRRRPAVGLLRQAGHRTVVDDLAVLVAPRRVVHLANRHPLGVARDDAIHQSRGVASGHAIFEQRGDVDQRGGVADRVVFVLRIALYSCSWCVS